MDNPLRDPLVVEVGDLLTKDEILEQNGATDASLERVLIVRDCKAVVGGQVRLTFG